ncbi:60S ribosomal protein L4 [Myotis davidii]|uniref:60S ribosomal protein L4 n=1 Tax=Myotis davidii TaxID=225400 RepID=L5MGW0_MYODS|nr:60S ribosomal protein L4 [Myotis davidii]
MFAPTKTWRRWHHRVNTTQKRYATCSALAASAFPAWVMSKGHRIEEVPEPPLVAEDTVEGYKKTKEATLLLEKPQGPCIIYNVDKGIIKVFRNIPGVTLLNAKDHKLRVGKAAVALEAKSDEKVVPSKKPVVGKKGKKAVGLKKQKKPLVGKRLQLPRNQQPRRGPQKRNPPQKKEAVA